MIVTTDIANIIYKDCKTLNINEMYQTGNIPEGAVTTERIIVHTNTIETGIYWKVGFVQVNLCVPDLDKKGTANLIRLNELERLGNTLGKTGIHDDTQYRYSVDSIGIEEDKPLKCHFVNIRILFETLNVK